ncbi:hypothetical protein ACGFZK_10040 [Streptomyces sp. NPDC048257]|uniref:hypothetical protein n=1 Tax=Streptomyces sp. NPDC048257 TaxID=3365526 RepID=UPI0037152FCA
MEATPHGAALGKASALRTKNGPACLASQVTGARLDPGLARTDVIGSSGFAGIGLVALLIASLTAAEPAAVNRELTSGAPMGATLIAVTVVVAALVIRTALAELREPGSGRRQWMFLRDPRAVLTGALTAVALGVLGWLHAGPEGAVWAALAGFLVAFTVSQGRRPR